jgi:hypothetical protein
MTPTRSSTDGADDAPPHDSETLSDGPFTASWDVTRTAETTFVTVRVTNDHPCERPVRVDNRLDGAVRPPRRDGVEEPGWDAAGVTTPVPGGGTVSLGYACHAPPLEPPISVRVDSSGATTDSPVDRALRSLGDHAPPRAAIPARVDAVTETPADPDSESGLESDAELDPEAENEPQSDACTPASSCAGDATDDAPSSAPTPAVVAAWFRAIDARVDTADRLTGPVAEATPVVASLGGRRGVATLAATLDRDASALRAVAERALSLAARVEETDLPDLEAVE